MPCSCQKCSKAILALLNLALGLASITLIVLGFIWINHNSLLWTVITVSSFYVLVIYYLILRSDSLHFSLHYFPWLHVCDTFLPFLHHYYSFSRLLRLRRRMWELLLFTWCNIIIYSLNIWFIYHNQPLYAIWIPPPLCWYHKRTRWINWVYWLQLYRIWLWLYNNCISSPFKSFILFAYHFSLLRKHRISLLPFPR